MKVIDLLNKIAKGEEIPKKVKFDNTIFIYDEDFNDYLDEDSNLLFEYDFSTSWLNCEVEIIEEETINDDAIDSIRYCVENRLNEDFTKKDLLNGDILTLRNGLTGYYRKDYICCDGGCCKLKDRQINSDLTNNGDMGKRLDIVKVQRYVEYFGDAVTNDAMFLKGKFYRLETIYERPEALIISSYAIRTPKVIKKLEIKEDIMGCKYILSEENTERKLSKNNVIVIKKLNELIDEVNSLKDVSNSK